jgi:hypothetical protein
LVDEIRNRIYARELHISRTFSKRFKPTDCDGSAFVLPEDYFVPYINLKPWQKMSQELLTKRNLGIIIPKELRREIK